MSGEDGPLDASFDIGMEAAMQDSMGAAANSENRWIGLVVEELVAHLWAFLAVEQL